MHLFARSYRRVASASGGVLRAVDRHDGALALCRKLEIAAPFQRATVSAGLGDHLRRDLIN